MDESHMGWKLVKGVRQDVINLFKLFASTNSIRYEDFSKVWKQINFSLIFSNRNTLVEIVEFTEELFQIVKEYLVSVYEFHTRVAALYTLYGLYFKQPIREASKIRFTKSEWEEVHSLIANCKAEKHYDIVFIHLKMYLSGAYSFTATVRSTGLERGFRKYSEKRCNALPKSCDIDLLYRPLVDEKLINSLVTLESLYCRKKAELFGKRNLVFIDGKFAKSLQEELKNYASARQKMTINNESISGVNNELHRTEEENEGIIRTRLKRKSFKSSKKNKIDKKEEEKKEENKCDNDPEKHGQRKRSGNKYSELIAKKKAQFYIKRLQEEYQQEGEKSSLKPSSLELPELDFPE